jgi:hypothetical protein
VLRVRALNFIRARYCWNCRSDRDSSRVPRLRGAHAYRARRWWSEQGGHWRGRNARLHPRYWRRDGGQWLQRRFDSWQTLADDVAMIHVNAYEAEAYAAFAGGRRRPRPSESMRRVPAWIARPTAIRGDASRARMAPSLGTIATALPWRPPRSPKETSGAGCGS